MTRTGSAGLWQIAALSRASPPAGGKSPVSHDPTVYRHRHLIENMFARLKDWRRIATRYDRCARVFLSACALAAAVLFWL
jgi:transposase